MTDKILEGPKLKQPVPKKSLGQLFFDSASLNGDKLCQVNISSSENKFII